MNDFGDQDRWLAIAGIVTAIWCVIVSLYAVLSESRQKNISLRTATESFAMVLIATGERLKNHPAAGDPASTPNGQSSKGQ